MTPFHTGKVQIGLLYQPKPAAIVGDMATIQTALLERRRPGHWFIEFIWRLL